MSNNVVNLAEKLSQFTERWSPRTVAQLNEYDIMVVKVQGEFVWHSHATTDDFSWFYTAVCTFGSPIGKSSSGRVSCSSYHAVLSIVHSRKKRPISC